MPRRIESLMLPGPVGALEALLEKPEDNPPREAALVCHPHPGHGGTMHNKVVYRIARGLLRSGAVVLRFNFRGVGRSRGAYDHGIGEVEDARAALHWMRARYPALPFTLAGFSFGSRVVLRLGCSEQGAGRLIVVGFPIRRQEPIPWASCPVRKIFIQSTRDEYGPREELQALFDTIPGPKEIHWVPAQDHFFGGALDEFEETVARLGSLGDLT